MRTIVASCHEARIMAYILPRAVIVLIAWGTTCLIMNVFTTIDPLVFYIAGGVWSLVGLVCFGYLHSLRSEADEQPAPSLVQIQTPAE
jgi:hypothetical protein